MQLYAVIRHLAHLDHAAVAEQPTGVTPAVASDAPVEGLEAAVPAARLTLGARLAHRPRVHLNVRVHTLDSFRYRDFRLLWAGTVASSAAMWVQQLVVGWLIYDLSRSAVMTSLGLGVGALPLLLVAPLGGLLADGWDRRKLLAFSFAYRAAVALGFTVVVMLGLVETWHIFLFSLMMGLGVAVSGPAWSSLVPRVVPRENLVNAFAVASLGASATGLAVPVMAGLLVAIVGAGGALLFGATMWLVASAVVLTMRVERPDRNDLHRRSAISDLADGARYVLREPLVLSLILFASVFAILIPPFIRGLMPVFASEVFNVGPAGLGLLMSSLGAGSVLGTFTLASLGDMRHKGRYLVGGFALAGAAMIAYSHSPSVVLALPVLILVTAGLSTSFSLSEASIQGVVPDKLRGRVSSLEFALLGLSPVGFMLSGGLAALLGAPSATMVAGIAMAVLLLGLSLRFRQVWRFE